MKRPTYYSANDVAEIFGRHPHTIRDWINHGCPTLDGTVKLQAVKLGKSWSIKDEWLAVFELRVRPEPGRPELEVE